MSRTTYKTAKVVKPFALNFAGYQVTVPAGATVSNRTASGYDDNYRFWEDWDKTFSHREFPILCHDLTYYGINVPAENCEPYKG